MILALACGFGVAALAQDGPVRTGAAAFGDWRTDAPGVRRHIAPDDLPPPYATRSAGNPGRIVPAPDEATPRVPPGFAASVWASGLRGPRVVRVAPNGDVFVAETRGDRIRVFRGTDHADRGTIFADGLDEPFGIAFWPPGPSPRYVYVGETGRVVRFRYTLGATVAAGPAQVIVPALPQGGHSTRDLAVAPDGRRLFVSVGSGSNIAASMPEAPPGTLAAWEARHGRGAAWGSETERAAVLWFAPDGPDLHPFANGIRNCAGLTVQPATGALWCATNERDGMGDNLPPDYATRVPEGGFFGWPWFYAGGHPDDRPASRRPDLAGRVMVPDVLFQAHSAPLGMTFYDAASGPALFPAAYRGDAFVAMHGSWNRARRTGYKIVRLTMRDGLPTGDYEDFLTGFVNSDSAVWGRPVDVAVARDGALLVTEDGNGTIWRVAPRR